MSSHKADPKDVESIDAIIDALYDTISFEPGEEPDWNRLRSLFLADGSLIPPRDSSEDSTQVLGIEAFIVRARNRIASMAPLKEKGFTEVETHRRTEAWATIAHVFSVYEGRFGGGDGTYDTRGINSVQLLYEDGRWWVVGVLWADETDDSPIPDQYLPHD